MRKWPRRISYDSHQTQGRLIQGAVVQEVCRPRCCKDERRGQHRRTARKRKKPGARSPLCLRIVVFLQAVLSCSSVCDSKVWAPTRRCLRGCIMVYMCRLLLLVEFDKGWFNFVSCTCDDPTAVFMSCGSATMLPVPLRRPQQPLLRSSATTASTTTTIVSSNSTLVFILCSREGCCISCQLVLSL